MPSTSRSVSQESDGTIITERRYGCYGWGLLTSLLLLAFVLIVSVILLVESDNAVVLLSVLLGALLVVAVVGFIFLRWQRRRAIERRDRGATEWIQRTLSQDQQANLTPSAPPASARSSWVHWTPWKGASSRSDAGAVRQYREVAPSAPRATLTNYD